MLRKKALRKILITTVSCFILLVLYMIPTKLNDDFINPDIDVIYTSNVYNSEIYLFGDNNYLVKSNLMLKGDKVEEKVNEILEHLRVDSTFNKPIGLNGVIPKNTKINSVKVEGNSAYLDFNNTLLDVSDDKEERVIESIVYSLTSIDGIDDVVISIDGAKLISLPKSNKNLPSKLTRDFGINKVYDITNRNGIQRVILYYTESISNSNYYVPVTKYVNDDRDKIKIIVDNLSSNYIYEDNLSSYLRNDLSVLDYETIDSTLVINFNKDIFPSDKLLESVEYTLSYSIFDNYDVDKILLKVNGMDLKEITKCSVSLMCNKN